MEQSCIIWHNLALIRLKKTFFMPNCDQNAELFFLLSNSYRGEQTMRQQPYPARAMALSQKPIWVNMPWSKITLSFLMISVFLIFATTGSNGAETVASWTENVRIIIGGTAIFSLASIMIVWAGRLLPRNF